MALALTLAFGCGPRVDWAGEWVGRYPLPPNLAEDPVVATMAKVRLTIKPDASFVLVEAGFDKQGRMVTQGSQATLTVERVLDRPPEAFGGSAPAMAGERTVKMQADGTLLFERAGQEPLTLSRSSKR